MGMNVQTVDTEYYKKMRLIRNITQRVMEYLLMGIENMDVEVHVSNMHFRTIKVTTNPLKLRMKSLTNEHVESIIDTIEYVLWHTLSINKSYFVLKFTIRNGKLIQDSIDCRFTEQDNSERK